MDGTKSLFTSKTFWGAIISIAAVGLKFFGIELSDGGFAEDIVALIGALLAVYGRVKAVKKIK